MRINTLMITLCVFSLLFTQIQTKRLFSHFQENNGTSAGSASNTTSEEKAEVKTTQTSTTTEIKNEEPKKQNKQPEGASQSEKMPVALTQNLTTAQLTLNLSGIKFPNPKSLGDTLNLSSISIKTSSPVKCKAGYILSPDGESCKLVNLLLMVNLAADNLILDGMDIDDLKKKQQEFKQSHPDFIPINCPIQTPFLSRYGCITCGTNNLYFSLKTLRCSKCPQNAIYNPKIRNCELKQEVVTTTVTTVVQAPKQVDQQKIEVKIEQKPRITVPQESKKQIIPEQTKTQAIINESKNLNTVPDSKNTVNTAGKSLISTTTPTPSVSPILAPTSVITTTTQSTRKVTIIQRLFVSNLEAENYLVGPGQTFQQFKRQIAKLLRQNKSTKVCPLDKPYSTGSECISCPSNKPYFFIESKTCVACQLGSTYNSDLHSCVGKKVKITTETRSESRNKIE